MKKRIYAYYRELDKIKKHGRTDNEEALRLAFHKLISEYANDHGYQLVTEKKLAKIGKKPDGTIYNSVNEPIGYCESKDLKDNFEQEITKKFELGYPKFNIIFENTENIRLYQDGDVCTRDMQNQEQLDEILSKFINYQPNFLVEYHQAVAYFKNDLKDILVKLRIFLSEQSKSNALLKGKRKEFLLVCRESINRNIRMDDIDEMIIQHILTSEIFSSVFGRSTYHTENTIAKILNAVVDTFFTGEERINFLSKIDIYYLAIKAKASRIADHHEKQRFLKEIYEQFYKIYNPKLADKLGVVYTPNEIVQFIIKSSDHLLLALFNKSLIEENVVIIDPAAGTGTFICDLIDYIPESNLENKYLNELHANEISILPYYVANLNIEATYHQKMEHYKIFKSICFVDTLDLVHNKSCEQLDLLGLTAENVQRITDQSKRKISVVMGNPPYNANQISENDNNKNKKYIRKDHIGVDDRIKETYLDKSYAQKTKMYDMYARFFRWATDRIENDGMVSFVTNRSFLTKKTFDGFRKTVIEEFQHIYIVDLGGEMRGKKKNVGNVFGITPGVAISFMVKKIIDVGMPCQIYYYNVALPTKESKLSFLASTHIQGIPFTRIIPDAKGNWLKKSVSDFATLLPMGNKPTKAKKEESALFCLFTNGVVTNRDEWLFDRSKKALEQKVCYFINEYSKLLITQTKDVSVHPKMRDFSKYFTDNLKWSASFKSHFIRRNEIQYSNNKIVEAEYRPFTTLYYYSEKILSDRLTENHYALFGKTLDLENIVITISTGERANFSVLATDRLPGLDFYLPNSAQCVALYQYQYNKNTGEHEKLDNITDWGLKQFQDHYNSKSITREEIFYYTYAVLHYPKYIEQYQIDLERELPHIPFYENFENWVGWGEDLMRLHIEYRDVKPYNLSEEHKHMKKAIPKLKADKLNNKIIIDGSTTLTGVPSECWDYYLGNRTAIEWVLDQHKKKKYNERHKQGEILNKICNPDQSSRHKKGIIDPDHKKRIIDLVKRICTVSVDTRRIVNEMTD